MEKRDYYAILTFHNENRPQVYGPYRDKQKREKDVDKRQLDKLADFLFLLDCPKGKRIAFKHFGAE